EHLPDLAGIRFRARRLSDDRRYAERFERDSLRIEQSQYVVIRRDDKRGGIRKWIVGRQRRRIDVTVWRDDRQCPRLVVHLASEFSNCWVGIKESILVK